MYDFSKREEIDEWYTSAVELIVKTPLRRDLAENPNLTPSDPRVALSYGAVLGGLNTVKRRLYKNARIRFTSASASLKDIIEEVRGIEE